MLLRKKALNIVLFLLCSFFAVNFAWSDAIFHDVRGESVQEATLKNKWVVVTYWATWCHTCMREIPELNRFYQNNHDKNVEFYGVNFDQLELGDLKTAMMKTAITFPVLVEDPHQLWQLGEIEMLPTTFIINPKGEIVKKIIGLNTAQSLTNTINALKLGTVS